MADNPVLVEVTRGDMVESRHRGAAAVVDADGRIIAAWGDVERPVYARSSLKPLQTLPLIESGAADRYQLTDADIALACASHNGEPGHTERFGQWLQQVGLDVNDLECGSHIPMGDQAATELACQHHGPSALHNNCSGKHAGFLTTALHLGESLQGYIDRDHPVQQRTRQVLAELSDTDLEQAPDGIDGCGIPVIGLSLRATALAMARMANPKALDPGRAAAARRIVQAMTDEPFMVAGSGRFDTVVMAVIGRQAAIKTGAEGFYTAMLPEAGLGIALKIDDGATRAAETAIGALLIRYGAIGPAASQQLADTLQPTLRNRVGRPVGLLRPAVDWLATV